MSTASTPRAEGPEETALILARVEALVDRLNPAADALLTAADALNPLPGQRAPSSRGSIVDAAYLHAAQCAADRPPLEEDAAIWLMENRERSEEELLGAEGLNGAELQARVGPW